MKNGCGYCHCTFFHLSVECVRKLPWNLLQNFSILKHVCFFFFLLDEKKNVVPHYWFIFDKWYHTRRIWIKTRISLGAAGWFLAMTDTSAVEIDAFYFLFLCKFGIVFISRICVWTQSWQSFEMTATVREFFLRRRH